MIYILPFFGLWCHNPMLVIPVDTLSLLFLPVCLNVVFLSLPRSLTAALLCSLPSKGDHRTVISHPAGHSVVTGFRATKKAGTQMRTDFPQKGQTYLLRWWLHIHVTGFEIQSRNCPLRLSDCRQFKAIQKRRYFLLAYRRHCPAESRLSHSNVKNTIQLQSPNENIYIISETLPESKLFPAGFLYNFEATKTHDLLNCFRLIIPPQ